MAEENFNPSSPYWNKFGDESPFALYSPLFLSLAIGDLPANDFARLISMYQRTLNDFEHGFESAMHHTNDDFEREAISHLKKSVKVERKTYDLVIKTMLISPTKQKKIDERENKYRAFLHDKSNTKLEEREIKLGERKVAPVYALAAIASSRRLYFNLCCRIQDIPEPSNMYKNWVDHFSSEAYKDSVLEIEDKLNKFSKPFSQEKIGKIENIYRKALKRQIKIFTHFQMTSKTYDPLSQLTDVKPSIVLEFDGTCASKDSASILVQARVDQLLDSTWEMKWQALSERSGTEIAGCLNREKIFGVIGEKMASGGEFKYEKLRTIFEDLAILEKEAITRVERSKLLENLSSENLKAAALKMELRSGCERFFQKIEEKHTLVQIISSSWCGELIRFVFSSSCPEINVHSNELPYDEVSVTTGDIERHVESALDKLKLFREEMGNMSETKHTAVFIGSNMPDLLCLIEADIGIVISPSPVLTGMAKHFGVSLVPLLTVLLKDKDWPGSLCHGKRLSRVIYTVSCWAEIQVFIWGR